MQYFSGLIVFELHQMRHIYTRPLPTFQGLTILVPCNQSKIMGFKTVLFQTFKSCCGTFIIYILYSTAQWNSRVLGFRSCQSRESYSGNQPPLIPLLSKPLITCTVILQWSLAPSPLQPLLQQSRTADTAFIWLSYLSMQAGFVHLFTLYFAGRHYALRKRCRSTSENETVFKN